MTSSKRTAKELVQKMRQNINHCMDSDEDIISDKSKNCALICVDEILNVWENQQKRRFSEWLGILNFWQDVKKEINRL